MGDMEMAVELGIHSLVGVVGEGHNHQVGHIHRQQVEGDSKKLDKQQKQCLEGRQRVAGPGMGKAAAGEGTAVEGGTQ